MICPVGIKLVYCVLILLTLAEVLMGIAETNLLLAAIGLLGAPASRVLRIPMVRALPGLPNVQLSAWLLVCWGTLAAAG